MSSKWPDLPEAWQIEPFCQLLQVCDIEAEELLSLRNGDKVRAYCHLNVSDRSVEFLLDCGATVNVLPFVDASRVNQNLTTPRPAEACLSMYDGTELKILGISSAKVGHPLSGKRQQMDKFVAAIHMTERYRA